MLVGGTKFVIQEGGSNVSPNNKSQIGNIIHECCDK
jgi:hypothetical protein